jgi:hypothetical protein
MSMVEEQSRIVAMMERGATFDDVEEGVINPASFSDDEKAALWLFAWSFIPLGKQRYEANQHIRRLAAH